MEPVASYRSRCGRTRETWPTATGPVFQHAAPLISRVKPNSISEQIVNPRQTPQPQPALGQAIRELRQKRGATLETVAKEAGITLNMLSLIERGGGNPTRATMRGIAGALGVPVSTLAKAAEKLEG